MRISRGTVDPAVYERHRAVFHEVGDAAARQPGFQHFYSGIDPQTGKIVAVSLWDTEEHACFPREALGDVVARVVAAGAKLEPSEVYRLDS